MDDLALRERLQPALLDRLIDDEPHETVEARDAAAITPLRLRRAVLRDLQWLLNAARLDRSVDWQAAPLAERTVINFGLPAMSGETASTVNVDQLEENLRAAIVDFEPRIDPATVRVRAIAASLALDQHNLLQFEISGSLWGQHERSDLLLQTALDLETGQVSIDPNA